MVPLNFLRGYAKLLSLFARFLDFICVLAGGLIAYFLQSGLWVLPSHYGYAIIIGAMLTLMVFPVSGLYRYWRGTSWLPQASLLTCQWFGVIILLSAIAFITKSSESFSREWLSWWWLISWSLLLGQRYSLHKSLHYLRSKGWNSKNVVVFGTEELGQVVCKQLGLASWSGFHVRDFIIDDPRSHGGRQGETQENKAIENLCQAIHQKNVHEVWLALPLRAEKRLNEIMHALRHSTVTVRFVPDTAGLRLINHSVNQFAGMFLLNLTESPMYGSNRAIKIIEDRLFAFLILLLISPLMLLIAIGVKLSSAGPVFYRQERVSWNGKPFQMLKFRSMPVGAEQGSGPVWAKPGEQRATRFGAFLRKTSLDELPQFLNVLKGEMSIVGPRPERPVFVDKFKEQIPDYMQKHLVKAGITGWAQVNGWRGDTDLGKRIEYDLYYIKNWSLWFDIRIILQTLISGFVNRNAY